MRVVFFTIFFCLIFVPIAKAQSLTLNPYDYPGLTFSSGLSFEQSSPSLKKITLLFGDKDSSLPSKKDFSTKFPSKIMLSSTPTPTQLPISSPTAIPTPTILLPMTPTPLPDPLPYENNSGGLNAEVIFTLVNSHRINKGLPAFQKDDKTCKLAQSRATEVAEEITNGHMHSGLRDRNLTYWNTENIISMRNEIEAFNWWINDEIHKEAIESSNTYSCVACSGNSCAQEFTNYQPK